jgi:hypothetical protein
MVNKGLRNRLAYFRHEWPSTGQVIEVPAQELFLAPVLYNKMEALRRQQLPSGINT